MLEIICIDHGAYQKKVKGLTEDSLLYTIKDARAAIEANPNNPKCGYYQDEIHYCVMELRDRKSSAEKKGNKEQISLATVAFDMAKLPYLVTETVTHKDIIVPRAFNEEDAIDQARQLFLELSHGRTTGLMKARELTEPTLAGSVGNPLGL